MSQGDAQVSRARRTGLVLADSLVRILPAPLLRALAHAMSRHDERLVAKTVTTFKRQLADAALPERVAGFEDLSFLFWTTPINRGILRQDFDEAALLFRTVRGLAQPRGVEIGRYAGGSTILIAAAISLAGGEGLLTSIDLAPQDDQALADALRRLGLDGAVRLVVGDANAVTVPPPLDFVLIDGDHSYDGARRDHLRWGEAVRVGGYVIHHDMGSTRPSATCIPELARLKADILARQSHEIRLVAEAGSLVVFQRIASSWTSF